MPTPEFPQDPSGLPQSIEVIVQAFEAQEDLIAALDALGILAHHLKPEVLPQVLNTPAEAYGGQSIIESLQYDPQGTLKIIQEQFSWGSSD